MEKLSSTAVFMRAENNQQVKTHIFHVGKKICKNQSHQVFQNM